MEISKKIRFVIAVIAIFLLSGCSLGGNAEEVVKEYLQADGIEGRMDYVVHSENIQEKMQKHYDGVNLNWSKEDIEGQNFESEQNDEMAIVTMTNKTYAEDQSIYHLTKVKNKWKIHWEASVGYNEMNLVEFKAVRPSTPITFRLIASLDDYYNYEFSNAQKDYYSIYLYDNQTQESFYVYVEKESPDGEAIFNALKSGVSKQIQLSMYIPEDFRPGGDVALLNQLISPNWK